jgi:hypothetical protein
MSPELFAALIQQVAIPELLSWLKRKQAGGEVIDDAAILAKLNMDADAVIAKGRAWLDAQFAKIQPRMWREKRRSVRGVLPLRFARL